MAEQEEDGDNGEAGRALVRDLLVNRLAAAGLKPRRGLNAAAHAKCMDGLVKALSYMARDNLETLAESILVEAAKPGPLRGVWPSEALIRQWAEAMQPRPFRSYPIVRSWLHSREGPVAEAGGYLVPLLRWLKRHPRPPGPYDLVQIRAEGADETSRIAAMRQRIAQDRAWPNDRAQLAAWMREYEEALQHVDDGRRHRRSQEQDGSDGVAA